MNNKCTFQKLYIHHILILSLIFKGPTQFKREPYCFEYTQNLRSTNFVLSVRLVNLFVIGHRKSLSSCFFIFILIDCYVVPFSPKDNKIVCLFHNITTHVYHRPTIFFLYLNVENGFSNGSLHIHLHVRVSIHLHEGNTNPK